MGFGMGMRMSFEMRMEPRLEQRMQLEPRLEQLLEMQMKQEITLKQYLAQESLIEGFIRWTEENNSWASFNKDGFQFRYATLPYKIAKPICDIAGNGFAHCLYDAFEALICGRKTALAKGEWVLFVVRDMIPKEMEGFVALHERGEEISLGDHYFASQLEFAYAQKRRKIRKYISFVDKEAPNKFVDLTQRVLFPVLPQELVEYLQEQGKRNKTELEIAEKLIEKYPLPTSVLSLVAKYEEETEKICNLISERTTGNTQRQLSKLFGIQPYTPPEKAADLINEILSKTLVYIDPKIVRGVSRLRVNDALRTFYQVVNRQVLEKTRRSLEMPVDFSSAYEDALDNKKLVKVAYTPEDNLKTE